MRGISESPHYRVQSVAVMGKVVQHQTSVTTSQVLSQTGKTPLIPANLRATVQRDGSVVLTFDDNNTKQVS